MSVVLIGWSGTSEPGGGRTARGYVDEVRVSVRRTLDGSVSWRCRQHGEGLETHCPHLEQLAMQPADPARHTGNRRHTTPADPPTDTAGANESETA
ncbi:hypothetical protein [Humibacillus xanthopallidus]|uniref:SWIM-type domain-containing protein n=1 Tax=Humibacillus xanthopallidus TaxID=412689 RepID=A0A543HW60_9MICO|nr:hypothetical protein [Humibacillus xanthopallidus]TQM62588.1 hypothetical protein FBY41_2624 [Humibacillus xanthopallidus]